MPGNPVALLLSPPQATKCPPWADLSLIWMKWELMQNQLGLPPKSDRVGWGLGSGPARLPLQLWITLSSSTRVILCSLAGLQPLKAASRSRHPRGCWQKGSPPVPCVMIPEGNWIQCLRLSLSFGSTFLLFFRMSVMGWHQKNLAELGRDRGVDQGALMGQVFPGLERQGMGQWAPPLPTPPGQETSNWKGGYSLYITPPNPHYLFQETERKASVQPIFAERVSHKTWITGVCDGMCWMMDNLMDSHQI